MKRMDVSSETRRNGASMIVKYLAFGGWIDGQEGGYTASVETVKPSEGAKKWSTSASGTQIALHAGRPLYILLEGVFPSI